MAPRDSVSNTLVVATALCIVCSVMVSTVAVGLRPRQKQNQQREFKKNILALCGLPTDQEQIDQQFENNFNILLVNLESGEILSRDDYPEITGYNSIRDLAKDPAESRPLPGNEDLGKIGRVEKLSFAYEYIKDGTRQQIVLPIRGKGLWSTLWGFIALEADLKTIGGISFYEHAETPGLGGEVDNPRWKEKWIKKQALDDQGTITISVERGLADPASTTQIDGLAGATITTRGVHQLVHFWLGKDGFGPFLARQQQNGE